MQKTKVSRAFTISEVLISLGIIGILCITLLSLNNFSSRSYQVATTKMLQVDTALKSWGKAVTKTNEIGLGASATITSDTSLVKSLSDYLNNAGNKLKNGEDDAFVAGEETYNNYHTITLDNGVTLNTKYLAGAASQTANDITYNKSTTDADTNLAIITANIEVTSGGTEQLISEEYVLKNTGVKSLASMYEGWDKYQVVDMLDESGKPTGERGYCASANGCGSGGCTIANGCTSTTTTGNYIYIKNDSKTACGDGQTGSILVQTIGSIDGTYTSTTNTCCVAPKVKVTSDDTCHCEKGLSPINAGYRFAAETETCQAPCTEGSYGKNGVCLLCEAGKYCDAIAMTASTTCPKGSYCPNSKDKKVDTNYHTDKYVKNDKGEVTDVKDGGLKKAVTCPKGSYCPDCSSDNEGCTKDGHRIKPIECLMGTYCPNDGMTEPIKCPAGTYGIKSGAKSLDEGCKKCAAGTYQDLTGQTSCETCTGAGLFSKEGATVCSTCPAGTYLNNGTCSPCQKGHYCPGGGSGKLPCAAGTYQDKEGQTSCKPCDCGYYQDQKGQAQCKIVAAGNYPVANASSSDYRTSGAAYSGQCPEGHACTGKCNAPSKCNAGFYASNSAKEPVNIAATMCTACPAGYKCPKDPDNDDITHRFECPEGTYQPYTQQTECIECAIGTASNTKARTTECDKCPRGTHGNNQRGLAHCVNCPAGTWSDKLGNISANDCTWCEAGTYSTKEGATSKTTCTKCPIDTYTVTKYSVAPANDSVCQHCPNGTYSLGTGQVDTVGDGAGVCKYCDIGTYFNPDNKATYTTKAQICAKCPSNTYGAKIPSKAPEVLKNTKFDINNYPDCEACPFGTAFTGTGATSVNQCVACKAGEQTNADGTCSKCKAGTYSAVSATDPNVKECVPCPKGTSTNGVSGATSINACKKCAQDTYGDEEGLASCKTCPAGTYSDAIGATSSNTCKTCPAYNSVYFFAQGHSHYQTLGGLLNIFACVPSQNITAEQRNIVAPEGYNTVFIVSDDGTLIDYIPNGTNLNTIKDYGGTFNTSANGKSYTYSTSGRQGWIYSNTCNAHGSSVKGGTLKLDNTRGRCTYPVNYTFKVQSPLVFDIQGDGLTFTSIQDGVQFNITGGGVEQTAWTTNMEDKGFDDAFLCIAKENDSTLIYVNESDKEQYENNYTTPMVYDGKVLNVYIESGKQLFGDQNGEKTGFDELSKYDDNGDGIIDTKDKIFKNLLLWSDLNKNGRVDYYKLNCEQTIINNCECNSTTPHSECYSPEMKTLSDMKISSISTDYSTEFDNDNLTIKTDEHGNVIGIVGGFMMDIWDSVTETAQSVWRTIVDVFFKTENG